MRKVTILRKWDNPEIVVNVEDSGIGIEVSLDSFITGLVSEVTRPLVEGIAQDAGNPTLWFTKESLTKNLIKAIQSDKAKQCFVEAADNVLKTIKAETSKVM
jgi:hypothetical protein